MKEEVSVLSPAPGGNQWFLGTFLIKGAPSLLEVTSCLYNNSHCSAAPVEARTISYRKQQWQSTPPRRGLLPHTVGSWKKHQQRAAPSRLENAGRKLIAQMARGSRTFQISVEVLRIQPSL